MIFVTVGSQLPFDRLVDAVDAWAEAQGRSDEVMAQVSATDAPPKYIEWRSEMQPSEFNAAVENADLIVGHAGTGTIMAALCAGKPVVVLARREGLQETRNDHQVATIERFRHLTGFSGTTEADDIPDLIEAALGKLAEAGGSGSSNPRAEGGLSPYATGPILDRLRGFLDGALS
jgi:UDP-N-acetylglucosamine transferase subunit ALG13